MKPPTALPNVILVDDDPAMLASLANIIQSAQLSCTTYQDPYEYLQLPADENVGCVVADLVMPTISGLDFLRELRLRGNHKPVIFLTGYGTIASAVEAMQLGAIDYLEKPIKREQLVQSVLRALELDSGRHEEKRSDEELEQRIGSLTARELEVMKLIAGGATSKQIASGLGISIKTVEVHRSHITKKLGVRSLAELVRLLTRYQLTRKDKG